MFKKPFSQISAISPLDDGEMNVGGILDEIRLIPAVQVKLIDAILADGMLPTRFMIIEEGASILDLKIAPDSGFFVETMGIVEGGESWLQEVSFDLAKNRPDLTSWLEQHIEVEFLAFITTKNKASMLLGDLAQPLKFSEETSASGLRAGQNKRVWKLAGMVEHPAYFLRQNYQDIDFNTAFNNSFNTTFQ
jgi:hypothetical protein